jgi:hypothetical protein
MAGTKPAGRASAAVDTILPERGAKAPRQQRAPAKDKRR